MQNLRFSPGGSGETVVANEEVSMLCIRKTAFPLLFLVLPTLTFPVVAQESESGTFHDRLQYRVLATKKTSTMEKEMNETAEAGFRFVDVMGGETSFGGSEVVVVMGKLSLAETETTYHYKLLATSKTSTMQKEMQEAGDGGYEYKGQTVFPTLFGGSEVVVILERERGTTPKERFQYLLLATKKTSTMQKELQELGDQGYILLGLTVSITRFGGNELVSILRRPVAM